MLSTLGLPSPRKNWLLRSVLTTSLSTTNCTLRQKARCSSGVMESLAQSGAPAGGQLAAHALPYPHPTWTGTECCGSDLGWASRGAPPRELTAPGSARPRGPSAHAWPLGAPRRTRARFSLVEGFRPRDSEQPRGAGPLPFLLDLRVLLPLLRPQRLPLLRRGLVAVITQQEGPDLPPD